jgi:hypothetical protein
LLEAARARAGLGALVLATEDGVPVASAASDACSALDLGFIGTLGSVCATHIPHGVSFLALLDRATGGLPLDACEVVLRGERLYVAAVGGRLPGPDLLGAIARILTLALPASA